MDPRARYLLRSGLLAAAYLAAAQVGFAAAVEHGLVSSLWPPAGVAVAALVLWGDRHWPGIALGALLANALHGVSLPGAAVIALGNTLEALAASWLLRRVQFRSTLERLRDVLAFLGIAAILATAIGASFGTIGLWVSATAARESLGLLWLVWWSGDAVGILVVGAALLTWGSLHERPPRRLMMEGSALLALLALVTAVVFSLGSGYVYVAFPFAVYAAYRLGPPGASAATAIVMAVGLAFTVNGVGPFGANFFLLQLFLALLAVTTIAFAAELAERRRAVMELRRSQARLAKAQELAGLGSWELELRDLQDINRNTLWWSDEVYRIFGHEPGAFPASNEAFFRAVHPDDAPRIQDAVSRALADGQPYVVDHRIVRPDGSEGVVLEHGVVERDRSGRPVRLLGTVLDITERRRLEDQLRQAAKMEAVGRLAGGVAHDFNNLLTAVTGYADLVLERLPAASPLRPDMHEIQSAADRAAALTRQLLAFSRQQVLQPRVIDLNDLVLGMEQLLLRVIGEDIDWRTALAPDLGMVRADPGQIEQVIMNVVVNARDAMPHGGRLTLETAHVDLDESHASVVGGPGAYVMLAVSDTGVGMDEQTRARIFEPFFTTKEQGRGTGLGLATSYGIVKQSGGHIWVYSVPGRGSTFKIYLPRVSAATNGAAPQPASPSALRGNETILLVEDDPLVRTVTRRELEKQGYGVLVAEGGMDALRLVAARPGPIDLVVTDVVMPDLSGPDLAKRLVAQRPGLKVLFLSGYTDEAVVRHGLLDPGTTFLQKPYTAESLARRVRQVLES